MTEKKIEGIGIFTEDGHFIFDSGLSAIENVLGAIKPSVLKGLMTTEQHGVATFVPEPPRAIAPPALDVVLRDSNMTVKRTTRNFIVTMKFPVIEGATATTKSHKEMWRKAAKAISANREEIKSSLN